MAPADAWVFEQLGGDNRFLVLSGYAAPFGRPRQEPVVTDTIEVRTERIYYPGNERQPTRHVFGVKYPDWELSGRWMDRTLGGTGSARLKAAEAGKFVEDSQPVRITWGDTVYAEGFIDKLECGRESKGQIAWKMQISIDVSDPSRKLPDPPLPKPTPASLASSITLKSQAVQATVKADKTLPAKTLAALNTLGEGAATAAATIETIVQPIQSFATAAFGSLSRILTNLEQIRDNVLAIREVYASMSAQALAFKGRAVKTYQGFLTRTKVETQSKETLTVAAQMQEEVDKARVAKIKTTYIAKPGDTWDSISSKFYGSADRANELREANGVGAGVQPQPGVEYFILK